LWWHYPFDGCADRSGTLADIVLGYDTAKEYVAVTPYFGAAVGRFASRIKAGTFTLDGIDYTLAKNNGPNGLHGGYTGSTKGFGTSKSLRRRTRSA